MPDTTTVGTTTVGEVIAAFLEECGIGFMFGVISIHNMPILDAVGRRGKIRFVPSRGEAGAANMADALARATGRPGVVVTSTGTAAGNAAGGLIEAQTAGTPVIHITGQIESRYLDRDKAYIHEARDQLSMLKAVSKAAYRVTAADSALATLKSAVREALTPPSGPVSIEIPIDIQAAEIPWPDNLEPLPREAPVAPPAELDRLADRLSACRRPLLWLGGGARHAGDAARRLADLGFGIVTSTQGRGIVPESDVRSLGAFNMSPAVEKFYGTCDAMVVAGSRLRGNETLKYSLKLPDPLFQIDVDARANGRNYAVERFVCGDAAMVLSALADRLQGRLSPAPAFTKDLSATRARAESDLIDGLGPYRKLVEDLAVAAGEDFVWVRDVTISNSTWGNRLLKINGPRDGVHALGGGIGQGLAMAIGASLGAAPKKTVCLAGDGGFQLNLGELATAVQEKADILIVLMNSNGYGVIKNIQDAEYGGRHYYVDIDGPDFAGLAKSFGVPHVLLQDLENAAEAFADGLKREGPSIVEIDMAAVGDFNRAFAGPPVRARKLEKV